jgi:hypothetical protein
MKDNTRRASNSSEFRKGSFEGRDALVTDLFCREPRVTVKNHKRKTRNVWVQSWIQIHNTLGASISRCKRLILKVGCDF